MKASLATLNIRRKLIAMASVLALAAGTATIASAQEASGPREGIKVHGHWIIEVKNPDGSRAQYREFDNHLVAEGAGALARLLGMQRVPSAWWVWVGNSNIFADICSRGPGLIHSCGITSPSGAVGYSPNEVFPTLTVNVPTAGSNAGKLVLSGSATSTSSGTSAIGYVLTQMVQCPITSVPGASCTQGASQADITRADVSPAIPIQPGQVIQITVIISFS